MTHEGARPFNHRLNRFWTTHWRELPPHTGAAVPVRLRVTWRTSRVVKKDFLSDQIGISDRLASDFARISIV
jgi:hypothetical protein